MRPNRPIRTYAEILVAFRSAKVAVFRGAKGDDATVIDSAVLTGQPLMEKAVSVDHPQLRIQAKMKRVQAGIQRWHRSGKDPSAVGKLMEGAQPLANGGKLDALEKLVDQALEMLGETEKVPNVYGGE